MRNLLLTFALAVACVDELAAQISLPIPGQLMIPVGSAMVEVKVGAHDLELYTFKPPTYSGERMILVLHGTLRNAGEYRDRAVVLGDRFKALIIAPKFDKKRFPSLKYQRGGVLTEGGKVCAAKDWTYALIPQIASQVRKIEQKPKQKFWIIGHSAGGQFVARMAAFQTTGAERLVAANPGSELFPTREMLFGYGFGGLPRELSDDAAIKRYLSVPLTLYLGTADNGPDRYLDQSKTATLQGVGRLQRGELCFELAQKLAQKKGWTCNWRLVKASKVGHDSVGMFNHDAVKDALFGPLPAAKPGTGKKKAAEGKAGSTGREQSARR